MLVKMIVWFKNCWNINLKRRMMQQKEQPALGLQLQPQECTYPLKQHALIRGKPKKRGGGGCYLGILPNSDDVGSECISDYSGWAGSKWDGRGGGEKRGGTMMG